MFKSLRVGMTRDEVLASQDLVVESESGSRIRLVGDVAGHQAQIVVQLGEIPSWTDSVTYIAVKVAVGYDPRPIAETSVGAVFVAQFGTHRVIDEGDDSQTIGWAGEQGEITLHRWHAQIPDEKRPLTTFQASFTSDAYRTALNEPGARATEDAQEPEIQAPPLDPPNLFGFTLGMSRSACVSLVARDFAIARESAGHLDAIGEFAGAEATARWSFTDDRLAAIVATYGDLEIDESLAQTPMYWALAGALGTPGQFDTAEARQSCTWAMAPTYVSLDKAVAWAKGAATPTVSYQVVVWTPDTMHQVSDAHARGIAHNHRMRADADKKIAMDRLVQAFVAAEEDKS